LGSVEADAGKNEEA